jgi:cytochrome c oxidase subunit 2
MTRLALTPVRLVAAVLTAVALPAVARAEEIGAPHPWQTGMQTAATEVARDIHWFNAFTLTIAVAITVFVLALLVVVMVRFNARANPKPSRVTHNTAIEVAWTVVPILILVVIAIPSFRLLYKQQVLPPKIDMTVKATGAQWYWIFDYPDLKDSSGETVSYEARVQCRVAADCPPGRPRLLATDNVLVVPVGKTVRVQVTGKDVIHAFAMPAFGVKVDAIPGRLNETWFRADAVGTYYGQCSELCGTDHAYMPIELRVVTEAQYAAWSDAVKTGIDNANRVLAAFDAEARPAALASR